jgi:hypothetical protein
MKSFASIAGFVAVIALCAAAARAQDPAKTDPAHFKVELENDRVRVLRLRIDSEDGERPNHQGRTHRRQARMGSCGRPRIRGGFEGCGCATD